MRHRWVHIVARSTLILFWILFLYPPKTFSVEKKVLKIGSFSTLKPDSPLPDGWEHLTFKKIPRQTRYTLVQDGGRVVVKAESSASSSGLIRKIRVDPKEYPFLQWSWKVNGTYRKGDVTRREGDDYPARIHIMFEFDPTKATGMEKLKYETARMLLGEYPPKGAITYIWGSHAPEGSMVPSPVTDRAMMFVVESGNASVNRWVEEERNILEDCRIAFGNEVPFISGVVIMTDSDNTGEEATAFYGDITFHNNHR